MNQSPPLSGSLQAGEFAPLLRTLVRQTASGRLDVAGGEGVRSVWLESGNVRAVISDFEEEKLGRWLVGRGKLEAHRMALSLLRQPEGVRFGHQLVNEGVLEPEDLAGELEALAIAIVVQILRGQGSYLLNQEVLPLDVVTLHMTTPSLLVRAVRTMGVDELKSLFLDSSDFLVAIEDRLGWADGATLSPQEAFLFTRVDGQATLSQLCRLTPLSSEECLRAAAALMVAGLVEPHDQAAKRPRVMVADPADGSSAEDMVEFSPEQRSEYNEIVRLAGELPHLDYYRRFSLTPEANSEQIQARFRENVRKYHAERSQEPHLRLLRRELETIQTALQDAINTLGYQERRARYDELLKHGRDTRKATAEAEVRRKEARQELVSANVSRAQEAIRTGDPGLAVELLDQAVRFDPQPELLLMLAKLELRNPMWAQRGLNRLRMAVSIKPGLVEAWWELSKFWARRQRFDRQLQCLSKLLEHEPGHVEARRLAGALRKRLNTGR